MCEEEPRSVCVLVRESIAQRESVCSVKAEGSSVGRACCQIERDREDRSVRSRRREGF